MAGEQSIQLINALAFARGTQEPTNRDVLWIDDNITGEIYSRLKLFNTSSGSWEIISRSNIQLLNDLKTVDGAGSGLDADTLQGYTPAQLMSSGGGGGSVPALFTGQLLVGQGDTIGTAQTVGGIATIDTSGNLIYIPGTISHADLADIGTFTHAQIDSHINDTANPHGVTASQVGNTVSQWNADSIEGNLTNVGTLGAGQDGFAVVWDNATSRFIAALAGGDSVYTDSGTAFTDVEVTIDNTFTFKDGELKIEGADMLSTTTVAALYDGDITPNLLYDFKANGDVTVGRDSTWSIGTGSMSFDTNAGQVDELVRFTKGGIGKVAKFEGDGTVWVTLDTTDDETNNVVVVFKAEDESKYRIGYHGLQDVNSFAIHSYITGNDGFTITGGGKVVIGGTGTGQTTISTEDIFLKGSVMVGDTTDLLGFYGVDPKIRQTVTGSTGGNAALQDLLAKLDNFGILIDATT